ncbi:MAG: hypothetical protein M1821_002349 [Bathelium mastoideum]|nr:MAG: hypothetical protein M1821_002349 [Bathelium mastoideum]
MPESEGVVGVVVVAGSGLAAAGAHIGHARRCVYMNVLAYGYIGTFQSWRGVRGSRARKGGRHWDWREKELTWTGRLEVETVKIFSAKLKTGAELEENDIVDGVGGDDVETEVVGGADDDTELDVVIEDEVGVVDGADEATELVVEPKIGDVVRIVDSEDVVGTEDDEEVVGIEDDEEVVGMEDGEDIVEGVGAEVGLVAGTEDEDVVVEEVEEVMELVDGIRSGDDTVEETQVSVELVVTTEDKVVVQDVVELIKLATGTEFGGDVDVVVVDEDVEELQEPVVGNKIGEDVEEVQPVVDPGVESRVGAVEVEVANVTFEFVVGR